MVSGFVYIKRQGILFGKAHGMREYRLKGQSKKNAYPGSGNYAINKWNCIMIAVF